MCRTQLFLKKRGPWELLPKCVEKALFGMEGEMCRPWLWTAQISLQENFLQAGRWVNFLEWLYLWVPAGFVFRPYSTGTIPSQQLHGDLKTLPNYSCFFWLLSFTCVPPVILLYV
ncbi:ganglioside induced differentiation associated protein 1 [Phyllostomus discolor]|uniref:Ganglioside induced differentiation associated protein 1 n=1 Tax=Phyllostomus discolor TaxID=89673 RepID=A0A833ZT38_9CHIR|nr:ganglioside induced differentiation associated protein 1 [Phyllostomus discolor]